MVTLRNPRSVVTECAILLNPGSLNKKEKEASRKTILGEQFIKPLDTVVKFGDCNPFVDLAPLMLKNMSMYL